MSSLRQEENRWILKSINTMFRYAESKQTKMGSLPNKLLTEASKICKEVEVKTMSELLLTGLSTKSASLYTKEIRHYESLNNLMTLNH